MTTLVSHSFIHPSAIVDKRSVIGGLKKDRSDADFYGHLPFFFSFVKSPAFSKLGRFFRFRYAISQRGSFLLPFFLFDHGRSSIKPIIIITRSKCANGTRFGRKLRVAAVERQQGMVWYKAAQLDPKESRCR